MATNLDLTNLNAFVRKTDETLRVTALNSDGSNFSAGSYVFYFTLRKSIPATSINDDTDTEVVISKTITVTLASPATSVVADIPFTQAELNIDPRTYYYDVKMNDVINDTISITQGYKQFQVVADITRRNV
jgi:hypothetical protein